MPTRATSLSVSDAASRRNGDRRLGVRELGLAPSVAEGLVIVDFGEVWIDRAELVSYPLDAGADVCLIAIFAAPSDKAYVMHAVVDGTIGYVAAHIRGQKMHDLEFS